MNEMNATAPKTLEDLQRLNEAQNQRAARFFEDFDKLFASHQVRYQVVSDQKKIVFFLHEAENDCLTLIGTRPTTWA